MDNPLLDVFNRSTTAVHGTDEARASAIRRFGFAIPTDEALAEIARRSPGGVVEIGAGTGYWAHALQQHGVDVEAFDIEPPPSPRSQWFAGSTPWHPVRRGDHNVVSDYPRRTLLIVWPPKNDTWPSAALELFYDAGGTCVVYVGEPPGGRTGDDVFHARLGELAVCVQCTYGSAISPCICGVRALWTRQTTVELPRWPGFHDDLHVHVRADRGVRSWRWRRGA